MSDGFKWALVIAALARVFGQHHMRAHADKLARFRAGYEAQTRKLDPMGRSRPWTSEELVELASEFHIPPFERRYPRVPDDKRCPFCRVDLAGRNAAPVAGVFADRDFARMPQVLEALGAHEEVGWRMADGAAKRADEHTAA